MAFPVLQLNKTLKYQKIYDAEHRAEKEEISKNIKIITNMTLTVNMKNKITCIRKNKTNTTTKSQDESGCLLSGYLSDIFKSNRNTREKRINRKERKKERYHHALFLQNKTNLKKMNIT